MKNNKNWIISVTAGIWQIKGIKEAKKIGLNVLGIDADQNAPGFEFCDLSICAPLNESKLIIDQINSLGIRIVGVVVFASEAGMELASIIREYLKLPGPDTKTTKSLLIKSEQRKIWDEFGVPGPKWVVANSVKSAKEKIGSLAVPILIKPIDSAGSRGVFKIVKLKDNSLEVVLESLRFSKSKNVIMEEFIPGKEHTAEIFLKNGNPLVSVITAKKKVKGTHGTVSRELWTPVLDDELKSKITQTIVKAFTSLGYMNGVGHAEFMIDKNGKIGMIEVAGRGGGFMLFDEFVPKITGFNLPLATIKNAIGEEIDFKPEKSRFGILSFTPNKKGRVKNIEGIGLANTITGIQAESLVEIGQFLGEAKTDADRMCAILSIADNIKDAKKQLRKAKKLIRIEVE